MDLDALHLVFGVCAPLVICGSTIGGILAHSARTREDIRQLQTDLRALEKLENERHAKQTEERHEDTVARGNIEASNAKILGMLSRGGSLP